MVLDKTPEEPRETIEMKASKEVKQPAATAETLQDRLQAAIGATGPETPQRLVRGLDLEGATGAAAAAGVLTAVDEDDDEGGEDAPVPDEFTYESDGEEE